MCPSLRTPMASGITSMTAAARFVCCYDDCFDVVIAKCRIVYDYLFLFTQVVGCLCSCVCSKVLLRNGVL